MTCFYVSRRTAEHVLINGRYTLVPLSDEHLAERVNQGPGNEILKTKSTHADRICPEMRTVSTYCHPEGRPFLILC